MTNEEMAEIRKEVRKEVLEESFFTALRENAEFQEYQRSETLGSFAGALSKAQRGIKNPIKNKYNPYFESKYSDLAACWDACRDPLAENEIAVIQNIESTKPTHVVVSTLLIHSSDEWILSRMAVVPREPHSQSVMATVTYLKRHMLCSMVGIAAEDEDGNENKETKETPEPEKAPEAEKMPRGKNWWTSDYKKTRYLKTENKNSALSHKQLTEELGFKYDEKNKFYHTKFYGNEEAAKILDENWVDPEGEK